MAEQEQKPIPVDEIQPHPGAEKEQGIEHSAPEKDEESVPQRPEKDRDRARSEILREQERLRTIEDRVAMIRRLILLEEDAKNRASEIEEMKSRFLSLSEELQNLPRNIFGRIKETERAAVLKYQMTGLEGSTEAKKISLDLLLQDINHARASVPMKEGESSADVLGQYLHLQEQTEARLVGLLRGEDEQQAA